MGALELVDTVAQPSNVTIQLSEHFDYRSIHQFKQCYRHRLSGVAEVVVDMAFTRYIDSSGIALLLSLYHWLGSPTAIVKITHCRPTMKQILVVARCDNRFVFE